MRKLSEEQITQKPKITNIKNEKEKKIRQLRDYYNGSAHLVLVYRGAVLENVRIGMSCKPQERKKLGRGETI